MEVYTFLLVNYIKLVIYDLDLYSWLVVNFTFRRQISHFLVHVAGPNVLIVIVAYSSFWIEVDSGPGRFLLTVLTLLSLITQFAGLKGTLPPVSYLSVRN